MFVVAVAGLTVLNVTYFLLFFFFLVNKILHQHMSVSVCVYVCV